MLFLDIRKFQMFEEFVDDYWSTLQTGSPQECITSATNLLNSAITKSEPPAYSALCLLLKHSEISAARAYIEQALFDNFDELYEILLPLLAHVYQRQLDFFNAHLLFSACARLNLFVGLNEWAALEAKNVASGFAEHLFFSDLDSIGLHSLGVRTRALYELSLSDSHKSSKSNATAGKKFPDFIIVGSAKCGTTFLYDLICRSPDVWKQPTKEIHYFTNIYNFGSGFYSRFFQDCPKNKICGEASPDYLDICNPNLSNYVDVAQRIYETTPKTKIIIILRDPALRAISLYNQLVTNKNSTAPRPGNHELNKLTLDTLHEFNGGYCLESGNYIFALRRFMELFGHERTLIIKFSELNNIEKLFEKLSDFLGIIPIGIHDTYDLDRNASANNSDLGTLYEDLRTYYAKSIADINKEFNIEL